MRKNQLKVLALIFIVGGLFHYQSIDTKAEMVNIYEQNVEGIYNIEETVNPNISVFSDVPALYQATLTVGNSASGIYMTTDMALSKNATAIGVKNRLLQEKVFFGYTNREVAPDYAEYNERSLSRSYIFAYREVGNTYRVSCTQYFIYGGVSYEYSNQTPTFTYEIY